jgi:hypothetical protein
MRPAQRSTMARLATSPVKVNQCEGDRTMSRQRNAPSLPRNKRAITFVQINCGADT